MAITITTVTTSEISPRVTTVGEPARDVESVITDAIFREKFIDHPWQREVGILLVEALVPALIFYTIVDWRWLLAWEALWLVSGSGRMLMRHVYRTRYLPSQLPRNPLAWSVARHVYHAYTWFVTGLTGLFCFVPNAIAWEIAAVAGLGMMFTLAPSDALKRSEILVGAVALPLPVMVMLLSKGTLLHLGLAALLAGFMLLLATWGAQQVGGRRNEISLRLALQREKQRAEEANVAKSRFLAAASHDLRQPLHALSLFVGILKTQIHYPAARDVVNNIENSVHALDALFHALLDISKLDAGIVVPAPTDFSMEKLLDVLNAEYHGEAQAKGLGWKCEPVQHVVRTDAALLETIIRNLVSNAIRYTHAGSVGIQCDQEEGLVRLAVTDTGIGIHPDRQREVFHEFVQLHNPERDRNKGLGLGLSIVDRLTRLLDIPLSLASAPGVGTTFSLLIPAGNASAVAARVTEPDYTLHTNPLAGKVVLAIDNEPNILEGMRILLSAWGLVTHLAESEGEAVAHLQNLGNPPDLIIADFRLRGNVTGAEVIRNLRALLDRPVAAIIVTGDTAPERLREASAAGFLLLHKPVKPAKLRLAILHLLRQ